MVSLSYRIYSSLRHSLKRNECNVMSFRSVLEYEVVIEDPPSQCGTIFQCYGDHDGEDLLCVPFCVYPDSWLTAFVGYWDIAFTLNTLVGGGEVRVSG
jgi:hypothetical protein